MVVLNSVKSVDAIKDVGYHRCGQGLYLQVSRHGTKSWLYRFKSPVTKKQREMGLGSLNFVSLAEARQQAIEQKKLVISGLDPIDERKKTKAHQQALEAKKLSFEEVAIACITAKQHEWSNLKHAQQWSNTLKQYAYPVMGDCPISDITTEMLLLVLEPIWVTKAETASRVRQRIETIWDYAKARNFVDGENPARLRGHLDKLLPKTSKIARVRHFPALPYPEISSFVRELRKKTGFSALGLEFLILTAARTSEVTGARWREIEIDEKLWTIPASRMKAGKEHRVPLSKSAVSILKKLNSDRLPDSYVFSGWKQNTSLSNNAFLALLKKMDRKDITPHGFRSTFRDWASEKAHYIPNETVELALAHSIRNKVEAAYRRGDQLERRRELMDAWSDYIETYCRET